MPDDLTTYTDDDLDALWRAVVVEQERRRILATAPQQAEELARQWADAVGRSDGDAWQQPRGAHDAYAAGAVVVLDGQAYRNDHAGVNPWRPGDVGAPWTPVWLIDGEWADTPPAKDDGSPAAWLSGVAYKVGDMVTHDGATWECVLAHTSHDGWKPSAATYAVWKKVA